MQPVVELVGGEEAALVEQFPDGGEVGRGDGIRGDDSLLASVLHESPTGSEIPTERRVSADSFATFSLHPGGETQGN